jgi:putative DNA primase/helicase
MAFAANPNAPEDGADWSGEDGNAGPDEWLASEVVRVGATGSGGQRSALLAFTASLRRRGYARQVADRAAIDAMMLLRTDPDKGPWSEVDVLAMVAGAWAKYRPSEVGSELSAWAESPGVADALIEVAEQGPAVPLPLPPPAGPAILGEPPEAIGPDHENALELKGFAAGRLLWNAGMGWLAWDGQRWVVDEGLVRHRVIVELGHELVRQAADAGPDGYTILIRRANRLGTVQGRDACLNYARDAFVVKARELDADVMVLNTPGGLVDLRSGALRPSRPGDLVTKMTRVPFVWGARDEVWERVVEERIPDEADREWLRRWMGYCLTGLDGEKAILAMHGPANTGKSTVTEPFARALGEYAVGWTAETIVANSRVNVQEALYRARGARLVTVNEMKVGTRLDEGVIKAATGGDTIVARALYQGSIEYRGQFKLWVHTNHVPDTRDTALLERMMFLGMEVPLDRVGRDPGVKTWLEESEGAGAAILWWAWEGLARMLESGKLGRPPRSDVEVEEHALRSDPVRRWLSETLEVGGRDDVAIWDEMYTVYVAWCSAEQVKPMGPTKLAYALRERGMEKVRVNLVDGRRVMGYRGWRMSATTESSWP